MQLLAVVEYSQICCLFFHRVQLVHEAFLSILLQMLLLMDQFLVRQINPPRGDTTQAILMMRGRGLA